MSLKKISVLLFFLCTYLPMAYADAPAPAAPSDDPAPVTPSAPVAPSVTKLFVMSAEDDPKKEGAIFDVYTVSASLDADGNMLGMELQGKDPKDLRIYTLDQLAAGVVIVKSSPASDAIPVLSLSGKIDAQNQSGTFTLRYLNNGIFKIYKSCDLLVRHDGQGWYTYNAYHASTITSALIHTWRSFGIIAGITTIEGICP